ncbi:MAG: hypothetical protein AAFU79_32695 [Myxococcota bacterium]
MLFASLVLNLLVLIPVTAGLLRDAPWVRAAYGTRSPARSILLAVYLAILLVSAGLLVVDAPEAVLGLLSVQVVYKLLTLLTVGSARHPVVASNVGIALFHAATVASVTVS